LLDPAIARRTDAEKRQCSLPAGNYSGHRGHLAGNTQSWFENRRAAAFAPGFRLRQITDSMLAHFTAEFDFEGLAGKAGVSKFSSFACSRTNSWEAGRKEKN
jgi:hypothetical protein